MRPAPQQAVVVEGRRHASVKSQGAYKISMKKTIPKKMGAKRTGEQYVIPGNIIFKQKGTIWWPGENTHMGRTHSIHASVAGYVKYYRDPVNHPKRQFIGVTFNRDDVLPYPENAPRKRKLSMYTIPRVEKAEPPLLSPSGLPMKVVRKEGYMETLEDGTTNVIGGLKLAGPKKGETREARKARVWNEWVKIKKHNRQLMLQDDYSYREPNWVIGRLMGTHRGKTPGTVKLASRHGQLRARRGRREKMLRDLRDKKAKEKRERRVVKKKAKEELKAKLFKQAQKGAKDEKKKKEKAPETEA